MKGAANMAFANRQVILHHIREVLSGIWQSRGWVDIILVSFREEDSHYAASALIGPGAVVFAGVSSVATNPSYC
jgi:RNA-splicing ligase RtcB